MLDWFVPPDRRDDHAYVARVYNSCGFAWVFGSAGFVFAGLYWATSSSDSMTWSHLLAGVFGFCLPFLNRVRVSTTVIAVLAALVMTGLQCVQIYAEGQHSWAYAWLVTVPLIGHNIGGARAGLWSAILAVLAMIGTFVARANDVFPTVVETSQMGAGSAVFEMGFLLAIVYVLGVTPVRSAETVSYTHLTLPTNREV